MDQELRKALNLKFSHLRDSEAALAFNKAPEKTEAAKQLSKLLGLK